MRILIAIIELEGSDFRGYDVVTACRANVEGTCSGHICLFL